MNFRDFKDKYSSFPLIKSSYFDLEENPTYLRRLVSEWVRKNWLITLKRGIYVINEKHFIGNLEPFFIANQLYEPSYVSLESALSFYGMIPEMVPLSTSITTRKTARFNTPLGSFSYTSIKTSLFWGYLNKNFGQLQVLIATPEKALLDLLYFRSSELKSVSAFIESIRLDQLNTLSSEILLNYAKRFNNKQILDVAIQFLKLYQTEENK